MYCPNCGTNVDERASFCPVCGTKLQAAEQSSQSFEDFQAQAPQAPIPPRPYQPEPNRGPGGYRAPIAQRSIGIAIVLSLVTCGIYSLYWLYCVVTDLNTACGELDDTSGGMVVLLSLVTCNIYMLYWYYKAGGKVNKLHAINGETQDTSLSILYLLLSLFGFGIVSMAIIQNELNKVADL